MGHLYVFDIELGVSDFSGSPQNIPIPMPSDNVYCNWERTSYSYEPEVFARH